MAYLRRQCPNLSCSFSKPTRARFYSFIGYYTIKWSGKKVRRYRCRGCKKNFSTRTGNFTYRQHKPYLNAQVFLLYSSCTTQRRLAKVLKTNRKTIQRKFVLLSGWAKSAHVKALESGRGTRTSDIQFDEMQSFEHTRLKPLSIALAVCNTSSNILAIEVGNLPYQGRLAQVALKKYGPRIDTSHEACHRALTTTKLAVESENLKITTDAKTSYKKLVKEIFPKASHQAILVNRPPLSQRIFRYGRRNPNDPLFTLNYTAAKIRHDLSRMLRRVWVTTKKWEFLQCHLDLYVAYNNGYPLP